MNAAFLCHFKYVKDCMMRNQLKKSIAYKFRAVSNISWPNDPLDVFTENEFRIFKIFFDQLGLVLEAFLIICYFFSSKRIGLIKSCESIEQDM